VSRVLRSSGTAAAAVVAVLFVSPLLWALWSSLGSGSGGPTLANYDRLVSFGYGLGAYLWNTAVVVVITVAGSLLSAVLAGYAFARFRFPGRNLLFIGILAILMVPHVAILIPLYVLLGWFGLGNTLLGLSLVLIMFQLPFSVFMMRNSFEGVPREIEEAALVDGCTSLTALLRVLLPAVTPGTVTVGLFAFLASWNEFITPLILLNDGDKFTLPVALVSLQQGDWGAIDFGALQAGVVVSALPCLALFLLLQRLFVSGFTSGALKG
jgi:multiple sugar transport system permease protein